MTTSTSSGKGETIPNPTDSTVKKPLLTATTPPIEPPAKKPAADPSLSFNLELLTHSGGGTSQAETLIWALNSHRDYHIKEFIRMLTAGHYLDACRAKRELDNIQTLLVDITLQGVYQSEKNYWGSKSMPPRDGYGYEAEKQQVVGFLKQYTDIDPDTVELTQLNSSYPLSLHFPPIKDITMSSQVSTPPPAQAATPAPILFKCHLISLATSAETLRTQQLCMAEWLRAYTLQENNGPEWFEGKPLLLFGYLEIDQLLTELIEHSFYAEDKEHSIAQINKFIESATAEDLDNKRELIRDSFLNFLPCQDDAGTDLSIYDHGYAYTTLYEFINKCIYHLQDKDADPACVKGLTPPQREVILGMKERGNSHEEYNKLAESMRVANDLKMQLNAVPN